MRSTLVIGVGVLVYPVCGRGSALARDPGDDEGRTPPPVAAVRSLVAAVNAVAASDAGIPPADAVPCPLDALPGSRAKLVPLLPQGHRELIADCARGRTRVRRNVRGLDLLTLIEDAADAPHGVATIQAFFADRAVDVALGSALSDDPYPIAFDWAVVLDVRTHTLFSFVVNCRD